MAGRLARAGRPIAGGWPGTISEARQLLASRLRSELASEHRLEPGEFDALAKTTYAAAKQAWLAMASPNPTA